MQKTTLAGLAIVLALGACSGIRDSRVNPFNWFNRGAAPETLVPQGGWRSASDSRSLIPVLSEVEVLPTPQGALLRASGQATTQGWWDAELRPVNRGRPVNGSLIYEFVVRDPGRPMATGIEPTRRVNVARRIPAQRLAGVQRIIVRGAETQRTIAR